MGRVTSTIGTKIHAIRPTRGLATVVNTKVPISPWEKDKYINYQRIEDNLKIVKDR